MSLSRCPTGLEDPKDQASDCNRWCQHSEKLRTFCNLLIATRQGCPKSSVTHSRMPNWRLPAVFWKLVQLCSCFILKHRYFVKLLLWLFLQLALLPNSLSFRCSRLETSTTVHTATCRIRTYMFTADFRTILLLREKQQHSINTLYCVRSTHFLYN